MKGLITLVVVIIVGLLGLSMVVAASPTTAPTELRAAATTVVAVVGVLLVSLCGTYLFLSAMVLTAAGLYWFDKE